jgi:hypothetical protein
VENPIPQDITPIFMENKEELNQTAITYSPITPVFSISFSWNRERITVQLENGEDVLKLAQLFSEFLTTNGIPNKVIKES